MTKVLPLPAKVRKELRDKDIRALYRKGYSMNEICAHKNVSKTTVFFAIRGRSKKRSAEKINNNHNHIK